jgi:hypothetical protein
MKSAGEMDWPLFWAVISSALAVTVFAPAIRYWAVSRRLDYLQAEAMMQDRTINSGKWQVNPNGNVYRKRILRTKKQRHALRASGLPFFYDGNTPGAPLSYWALVRQEDDSTSVPEWL